MSDTLCAPPPCTNRRPSWPATPASGRAAYDALVAEAEADPDAYWGRLVREFVGWKKPFHARAR